MKKITLFIILLIATVGLAEAKKPQNPLSVLLQSAVSYQCADKTKLSVRYYTLSDKSLEFVKVSLNGKTHTLPQAVSGSGIKYSDDLYLTWWAKGDSGTVFASNGGPEGTWPLAHGECNKIK
jgi:membrane-bound inhibitor of C-type lysozyme